RVFPIPDPGLGVESDGGSSSWITEGTASFITFRDSSMLSIAEPGFTAFRTSNRTIFSALSRPLSVGCSGSKCAHTRLIVSRMGRGLRGDERGSMGGGAGRVSGRLTVGRGRRHFCLPPQPQPQSLTTRLLGIGLAIR